MIVLGSFSYIATLISLCSPCGRKRYGIVGSKILNIMLLWGEKKGRRREGRRREGEERGKPGRRDCGEQCGESGHDLGWFTAGL